MLVGRQDGQGEVASGLDVSVDVDEIDGVATGVINSREQSRRESSKGVRRKGENRRSSDGGGGGGGE